MGINDGISMGTEGRGPRCGVQREASGERWRGGGDSAALPLGAPALESGDTSFFRLVTQT